MQLGQLIIQPGLYHNVLAELRRLYGSRQAIIKSSTSVIENLKPFNNSDYQGLAKLSSSLKSVVATMQLCAFDAELNSYSNVEFIVIKTITETAGEIGDDHLESARSTIAPRLERFRLGNRP